METRAGRDEFAGSFVDRGRRLAEDTDEEAASPGPRETRGSFGLQGSWMLGRQSWRAAMEMLGTRGRRNGEARGKLKLVRWRWAINGGADGWQ